MTTYELERLLNEHFGELSVRERRIAIRSAELYRDRMFSHWNELREKAAIAAMQGILSNPEHRLDYDNGEGDNVLPAIAIVSVKCADALVEELKKNK